MIFTTVSPERRSQSLVHAMPYSPLFVFGGNASALISSTLQALSYSAAAVGVPENLPPILRPP
jgi:hypothetical protein